MGREEGNQIGEGRKRVVGWVLCRPGRVARSSQQRCNNSRGIQLDSCGATLVTSAANTQLHLRDFTVFRQICSITQVYLKQAKTWLKIVHWVTILLMPSSSVDIWIYNSSPPAVGTPADLVSHPLPRLLDFFLSWRGSDPDNALAWALSELIDVLIQKDGHNWIHQSLKTMCWIWLESFLYSEGFFPWSWKRVSLVLLITYELFPRGSADGSLASVFVFITIRDVVGIRQWVFLFGSYLAQTSLVFMKLPFCSLVSVEL